MRFLSRHASVLALLCCLLAALAAPYLVAADPDSSVFRSGAFPVILVLIAYFPLKNTLQKTGKRTLICGLVFGFLLSLSLSLGSELTFYNGFSDGAHSMLRRILIPVIAAPFLGTLAAKCMEFSLKCRRRETPLLLWSSLIFVCWLPVLLAYWPGMTNYDFGREYAQLEYGYYLADPILYSFIQNEILLFGQRLGSLSYGILILSLLQMTAFSLALGRICRYAARRANIWLGIVLLLFFGFHPIFSVISVSRCKAAFFTSALIALSLDVLELLTGEKKITPVLAARFIASVIIVAGFRNNGIVVLFALPFFVLAMRPHRTALLLSLAGCLAAFCLQTVLVHVLSPAKQEYNEYINVQAQQLVRANAAGALTEEESENLKSWYENEKGLAVFPHFADFAKFYIDANKLKNNFRSYLSLWLEAAPHSVRPYIEAFLMLNIGSWYPDDTSHSTIYLDTDWLEIGYLDTRQISLDGFTYASYLPKVHEIIEKICYENCYQKVPLLPLLFAPAVYFFMFVFAALMLIARGKIRLLPAMLGVFFLWGSYLLVGPCTLARYMMPLFCMAPVMLIVALTEEKPDCDREK